MSVVELMPDLSDLILCDSRGGRAASLKLFYCIKDFVHDNLHFVVDTK